MQKSPFKFLDSYTKEDLDIFFGRDKEIGDLYSAVFVSKILLVYGISGSGKSSLLNCGLANKFNDTDWLPVNIRRGNDINQSLLEGLSRIAITKTPFEKNDSEGRRKISITKALQSVYLDHFRPVYLIFDQFEELFIFGSREEKDEFIKSIRKIIDSDLQCRIILSVREEYLAGVTEFEKIIPDILSNRIRIEKMTRHNAIQAIEGPCRVHKIEVEEGFSEALLDRLNPGSPEIELTYLQVCLDRIFKDASGGKSEGIRFTLDILDKQGDVKDLLGSFLEEQVTQLDDPETGLVVLKSFVSVKGTRHHITEDEAAEYTRTLGRDIDHDTLRNLIRKFISLRILRDKDESGKYELRHDSLASKIYEKITLVEKELLEIRQFIDNAYANFEKRNVLLGEEDIRYIAPYEDKLFLSEKLQDFLDKSKREIIRSKRRRQNILIAVASVIIAVLSFFTIWASRERNNALDQQVIAENQRNEAVKARSLADSASVVAMQMRNQAEENEKQAVMAKNQSEQARLDALIARENALREKKRAEELSLIAKEQAENAEREKQVSVQQRLIAENAEKETKRLNRLSTAQNLALKSVMLEKNPELMGILAVQAFLFNKNNGGNPDDPIIYDALNKGYSTLDGNKHSILAGSPNECKALAEIDNKLVSADLDGNLRTWTFDGVTKITDKLAYVSPINFISFIAGGSQIITGHDDLVLRLYKVESAEKVSDAFIELKGHTGPVRDVGLCSESGLLASAGMDSLIIVWNIGSGTNSALYTIRTPSPVRAVVFCGTDSLATAQWNGSIILWNLKTMESKTIFASETELPLSLAWDPNKRTLLSGCSNGMLLLFHFESNGTILPVRISAHFSGIDKLVFNKDFSLFATSSWDRVVRIFKKEGFITPGNLEGRVREMIFTSDNRLIASMSDMTIRVLESSSQNLANLICGLVMRNLTTEEWNNMIGEDIPYEETCTKAP